MDDPHSSDVLKDFPEYELAIELYENDEAKKARQLFEKLLRIENFPDKQVCHYLLAQLHMEEHNDYELGFHHMEMASTLGHVDAVNVMRRITTLNDDDLESFEIELKKVWKKKQDTTQDAQHS